MSIVRRTALSLVSAVYALTLSGNGGLPTAEAATGSGAIRPNVLLMVADDLGFGDVGYNGSDLKTPNLDRLAGEGARLDKWYASLPSCTPTRFSLLTGRLPQRSHDGLERVLMPVGPFVKRDSKSGVRADETTLAETLKAAGYRTALFGKWHLGYGEKQFLPTRHGFDVFEGHLSGCIDYFTLNYGDLPDWYRGEELLAPDDPDRKRYSTDVIADAALRQLRHLGTNQSFFLTVAFNAPHYGRAWDPGTKRVINVVQAKPEVLASFAHIEDPKRRTYAAAVWSMDLNIGRILAFLKQAGLEEKTWVIFTSDNGGMPRDGGANGPLRGEKGTLFEGGVRVPGLMRWPGKIRPGTVINQVASVLDVFPTVCDQLGIPTNGLPIDGMNLSRALFEGKPVERSLFFRTSNGDRAFVQNGWKYLRHRNEEMLFDLRNDPFEKTNLVAGQRKRLAELESAWSQVEAGMPRRNP